MDATPSSEPVEDHLCEARPIQRALHFGDLAGTPLGHRESYLLFIRRDSQSVCAAAALVCGHVDNLPHLPAALGHAVNVLVSPGKHNQARLRQCLNYETVIIKQFDRLFLAQTDPICERARKSLHPLELRPRGHHGWLVKPTNRSRIAGR